MRLGLVIKGKGALPRAWNLALASSYSEWLNGGESINNVREPKNIGDSPET